MSCFPFLASLSLPVKWVELGDLRSFLALNLYSSHVIACSMYFRYISDSETSLEKRVGFWLRKNARYVFHQHLHPKIVSLKIDRILVFCSFYLKIINDFLLFRLILVNATESIMYLSCLFYILLIWKKSLSEFGREVGVSHFRFEMQWRQRNRK